MAVAKHKVEFFNDLSKFPNSLKGGVVIPGNFDGWHLGHRQLCLRAKKTFGLPIILLTFEPHPREFFVPDGEPFRLSSVLQKEAILSQCHDICAVVTLPFNDALASMSADDFIDNVLIQALGAAHVIIGHDFRFGCGRSGGYDEIKARLPVTAIEALNNEGGEIISSSIIRDLISKGRVDEVHRFLGYNYSIAGIVEEGDKLGRDLGFRTANVGLGSQLRPKLGVYACRVLIGDSQHDGVLNYGFRPTVGGLEERFEVHIFDFTDDIYGEFVEVFLLKKLRDEKKFNDIEELKTQILADCKSAKIFLQESKN